MAEFLTMGGYAPYVWSAYGITAVVLVATVVLVRRGLANTRDEVRRAQRSAQEMT